MEPLLSKYIGLVGELQSCLLWIFNAVKCANRYLILILWVNLIKLELQWRQAPPCSSWDTGREAPFIFSPGV